MVQLNVKQKLLFLRAFVELTDQLLLDDCFPITDESICEVLEAIVSCFSVERRDGIHSQDQPKGQQ